MIHVPELKSGEHPFDPDIDRITNPWKTPPTRSPQMETELLLNLAVTKEAVTALHKDEDAEMQLLETVTSTQTCDIVTEHEKFLRTRTAAAESTCKNEEQKSLFRAMTKNFLAESRARAAVLQHKKAVEYWRESVEAQNREFLARALRNENVVNDATLKQYKNLIFYNLENVLESSPEAERKATLAAATAALYRKVLEKRIELDPAGALKMLEQKETANALGEIEIAETTTRAQNALRESELDAAALAWLESGKTPEEAKESAHNQFKDEGEQKYVLHQYGLKRFTKSKVIIRTRIADADALWEELKVHDFDENAFPAGAAGNDPALAECLRLCLQKRGDAGGGEIPVDYPALLDFLVKLEKTGLWKTMEWLREEKNFYALLAAVGGPGSETWGMCVRLLSGTAEVEDGEVIAALRFAWGAGRSGEFMASFAAELRGLEEKRPLAVAELVGKIAATATA